MTYRNSEATKSKIKNAFLSLYQNKPYQKISVTEIAECAGVSRASFYVYYENITTMIIEMGDEYLAGIKEIMMLNDYHETINCKMAQYIDDNKLALRLLLVDGGVPDFIEKIGAQSKEIVLKELEFSHIKMNNDISNMIDFMNDNVNRVMIDHIDNPYKEVLIALNSMDKLLMSLIMNLRANK